MHRRSLKLKVMAALFSAAFLLGAGDARAAADPTSVEVTGEDQTIDSNNPYGPWTQVSFTGSGTLTVTADDADTWHVVYIDFDNNDGTINAAGNIQVDSTFASYLSMTGGNSDYAGKIVNSEAFYDSEINADGNITVESDVSIKTMTAGGNIDIGGNLNLTGDDWNNFTARGDITIDGDVSGHNTITAGGDITIGGDSNIKYIYANDGTLTINGNINGIESSNYNYSKLINYFAQNIVAKNIELEDNTTYILVTNQRGYIDISSEVVAVTNSLEVSNTISADYIGGHGGYCNGNISAKKIIANIIDTTSSKGNVSITADSITAKEVYANEFLTGIINASSVYVTEDQNIEGNYSLSNQAILTGGLAMNSQKITGVGEGGVSATSTDLVNGAQLYAIKGVKSGALTAGGDIAISSADAISVSKTGGVSAGDSGILSGGVVYTTTNAMQTSLEGIASTVSKNSASITSLEDTMGDLKKSVAGINSTVTNTTKNLSSSLSNRLQTDLGNLSDDSKSVIKNLIAETLRGINVSSASIVSSNEASLNNVSISSVSIMPAPVEEIETVNPNVAKVDTTDVDSVYDVLDTKVGKTDFEMVKAGVDSNATAIATNVEDIKANASAIDALKTSKSNADGSNLDVGAYSAKLGTGKIEKDNAGLVTGGTVYSALDQKADASYVDAGLGVMSKQLDSVKQTATRDMNRMGANAAALASLHPQDYNSADKLDFAAGYGHYHDSNATAVGAFYRPNASTMVSLAGTVGNGDSMVSAGFSFKLGMNANVEKVMISKDDFSKQKAVNQEMKGHLDNQTARLERMEAAIAVMISR